MITKDSTMKRKPVNPSPALFLSLHHACQDGHAFAMQYPTMADVWDNCKRPDWLLWILDRLEMPLDKDRRLFACWCAVCTPLANGQTTRSLLTDPRSLEAVRVATLYAMGKATAEQRKSAYAAAYAAAPAPGLPSPLSSARRRHPTRSSRRLRERACRPAIYAGSRCRCGCHPPPPHRPRRAGLPRVPLGVQPAQSAYAAAYAAAPAAYAAAYAAYAAAYAAAPAARAKARLAQANQLRTLVPNPFLWTHD